MIQDTRSPYSPLGLALRSLRDLRGANQRTVAASVGKTQVWLSCLERGREEADREEILGIAKALRADEQQTSDLIAAWAASSLPRATSGAAA